MKLDDYLSSIKTLAITGHTRPDGDCAGSTLALYEYVKINYPEVDVDVYLEKPTVKLEFLKNFDKINSDYDLDKTYDLMVCLDSASLERIGKADKYFKSAKLTMNIDHHVSNPGYADENYVFGGWSSTCEVLYGFIDPKKINRDIAICLYTGIIYDTGVFKYEATTPATMRVAADLMEYDIPTNFIIDESFFAKTYDENRVFGYCVLNSCLGFEGRVIYSYITKAKLDEFEVSSKELEGIAEQLRLTKDVWCSIFLHETADHEYKVSFRSGEKMDVNEIACKFGGGGHVRAAGCTVKGNLVDCIDLLLTEVGRYFARHK